MEYLVIGIASFLASGLTLFSGFGLGTLLFPVFALFFPLPLAVALTGIVHLLNNLLKLLLFRKHADRAVVARFGLPALLASFAGAQFLAGLAQAPPWMTYELGGRSLAVTPLGVGLALLLVLFALWEVLPSMREVSFPREQLVFGGFLSGFFGGLSGHQGALRSAFLARLGLGKEGFIGTGVVIACLVDLARLPVYALSSGWEALGSAWPLLATAVLSAFLGVFLGGRLVGKVAWRTVQWTVAGMILAVAIGLGAGFW
jgi:uncharacterized membrane protein YfcA